MKGAVVVILDNTAYLCNSYVKGNEKQDLREMSNLKNKIALIKEERFILRGKL